MLDAARLFAFRGVDAVSLRDIAASADVHLSLIRRYVGNRETLVELMLRINGLIREDVEIVEFPYADDWYDKPDVPGVPRHARALPRRRADPAADPRRRRRAGRRAARYRHMGRIIARVEKGAIRAVVGGGSYIGLELTEAFKTRGLQTTVVERSERLMPWLDPEITRILDYHVNANGVDLRLGTSATAVRRSESNGLVLDLDDGASVEADIVVFAAGVRPSVQLAREAGIEFGSHGGIKVDAHMRTFAPDILAAGNVVETSNFLTGEPGLSMLAGPANREGWIAAERIAGRDSAYRGTRGPAS